MSDREAGSVRRGGLFQSNTPAVEDYELWLRMLIHGYRAVRPAGTLVIRRETAQSMSKDARLMYGAHREVWRLVAEEYAAPEDVKSVARARLRVTDRKLAMLDRRHPIRRALGRMRLAVGSLRRRLLAARLWYEDPPPEVARAFPDLKSL